MEQPTPKKVSAEGRRVSFIMGKPLGIAVFLVITLVGSLGAGESMDLPTNVCWGDFCGPDQQKIWDRFQAAGGLNLNLIPKFYAGVCYHHSRSLDPHVPQFGGVLLDKINDMLFFHGRFSFHIRTNPYTGLDLDTARNEFPKNFEIALYDRFAYAEAVDSFAPFRYWFRQENGTDMLLMVGFFGFDHTILCSLE